MKFIGVRAKMLLAFAFVSTICSVGISFLALLVFWQGFERVTSAYLKDVTNQSTNNLNIIIEDVENMNIQILSSSVIQEQLRRVNGTELSDFQQRSVRQVINNELERVTLFGADSVSLSVISLNRDEYTLKRTGKQIECAFTEEEIYKANGSTLWKLVGKENNICVAKAIIDLVTMQPIGYINIVYKNEYFREIVEKRSSEYSSTSYLVDQNRIIVSSSREEEIGEVFPDRIDRLAEKDRVWKDTINQEQVFLYVGQEMQNGWTLVEVIEVREFYKNIYSIIAVIVGIVMIFLLFGVLVILLVTKKIAEPTQKLLHSMQLFGQGELSQRVDVVTNDEVGMIGYEYNRMADNIENLIKQVYEMEIAQKQSEIDFLQMQINPHFLYNTLDTIGWLTFANENEKISEVVVALAELLRAMVKRNRFISIEEELYVVKDYLLIQKYRFGDRISVRYEVDETIMQYQIPNFILQPLIENAIIHGLEPKITKGNILIRIKDCGPWIGFFIEDDGIGMSREEIEELYKQCNSKSVKGGIGLKNVYRRLILCYGEESRIQIQSEEHSGMKISFKIPKEGKERGKYEQKSE